MKRSYAGFILWLAAYVAALLGICFIPAADSALLLRLLMLLTAWFLAGLTFHVWRTEQVYWYNGITYEEAEAAGSERRKAFAWRHFRIFGVLALAVTVVSGVTWLLGWFAWIDLAVCAAGVILACVRTAAVRL